MITKKKNASKILQEISTLIVQHDDLRTHTETSAEVKAAAKRYVATHHKAKPQNGANNTTVSPVIKQRLKTPTIETIIKQREKLHTIAADKNVPEPEDAPITKQSKQNSKDQQLQESVKAVLSEINAATGNPAPSQPERSRRRTTTPHLPQIQTNSMKASVRLFKNKNTRARTPSPRKVPEVASPPPSPTVKVTTPQLTLDPQQSKYVRLRKSNESKRPIAFISPMQASPAESKKKPSIAAVPRKYFRKNGTIMVFPPPLVIPTVEPESHSNVQTPDPGADSTFLTQSGDEEPDTDLLHYQAHDVNSRQTFPLISRTDSRANKHKRPDSQPATRMLANKGSRSLESNTRLPRAKSVDISRKPPLPPTSKSHSESPSRYVGFTSALRSHLLHNRPSSNQSLLPSANKKPNLFHVQNVSCFAERQKEILVEERAMPRRRARTPTPPSIILSLTTPSVLESVKKRRRSPPPSNHHSQAPKPSLPETPQSRERNRPKLTPSPQKPKTPKSASAKKRKSRKQQTPPQSPPKIIMPSPPTTSDSKTKPESLPTKKLTSFESITAWQEGTVVYL